ncbi:DUF7504 family protein [Natrarchaeobius chitinivorans]|uniref:Uncharacterized protein n=1 Tax=Natrarchaeobius chitinivorans TaxID=1679083 RepID=A0A3N6PC60_NATCH|nr:hypothetical protein [Natrarchaeobius chitinivorans]RQG96989.1 hypothetical protein EA473_02595 [Natrarchaeobius chitinivorans]
MVYNWRCRQCEFAVWSANSGEIRDTVQDHLLDHHRQRLSKEGFQVSWSCPYCDSTGIDHDKATALQTFRSHLFGHAKQATKTGARVSDEIGGTGNVLVLSAPESTGADTARAHFLSPDDVAILVTMNVSKRLHLLNRRLQEWPKRTIVVTTSGDPLANLDDLDVSGIPLEVVQLDKGLGLAGLGETISRVIAEHNGPDVDVSVEFDVLSEIIDTFELERVFRFIHLLNSRIESANALSHYYCNPEARSKPTINLIGELFDLTITATDERLVLEG